MTVVFRRRSILASLAAIATLSGRSLADTQTVVSNTDASAWPMINGDVSNTRSTTTSLNTGSAVARWDRTVPEVGSTQPIVYDGSVYIATDEDRSLYRLSLETGAVEWQRSFSADTYPFFRGPIVATTDYLYVQFGDEIQQLDRSTGDQQQSIESPNADQLKSDGERLYAAIPGSGVDETEIAVYSIPELEEVYRVTLPETMTWNAVALDPVHERLITSGRNGPLRGLSATTGEKLWTSGSITARSEPIVAVDREETYCSFVGDTEDESTIQARYTDGELRWEQTLSGAYELLAFDGSQLYCGSNTTDRGNDIIAIDVVDGELIWQTQVTREIHELVATDAGLLVGLGTPEIPETAGGVIRLYSSDAGDPTWEYRVPAEFVALSVAAETIALTAADGSVIALDTDSTAAPTVEVDGVTETASVGDEITIKAAVDAAGSELSFNWNVQAPTETISEESEDELSFYADTAGLHQVELTVTDDAGRSGYAQVWFRVNDPTEALSESAGWTVDGFNTRRTAYNPDADSVDPDDRLVLIDRFDGRIHELTQVDRDVFASTLGPNFGSVGRLHAIDRSTETARWTVGLTDADGGHTEHAHTRSTVLIDTQGSISEANLYALDRETGDTKWVTGNIAATLAVDSGVIYGAQNGIVTHDIETGEQRWNRLIGDADFDITVDGFALAEDRCITAGNNEIVALSVADGSEFWTTATEWDVTTPPVIHAGSVYVGTTEPSILVVNLDGTHNRTISIEAPIASALAFDTDRNVIYGITDDDTVIAIDAESETQLWRTSFTAQYSGSPVTIATPTAVLVGIGSTVAALDVETGSRIVTETTSGTVRSLIGTDTVYIGDDTGGLYRLGSKGVPSGPTEPIVGENPPQDLDGDGLYEDITGDGELTIVDVQALFENLHTDRVQSYPDAFNFSGEPTPEGPSIIDVQALFERLRSS